MSERKWTDLERRIRWFFKNCGEYIDSDALDIIIMAKWNNPRDKLVFDIPQDSRIFEDILEMAKKLENLQSK